MVCFKIYNQLFLIELWQQDNFPFACSITFNSTLKFPGAFVTLYMNIFFKISTLKIIQIWHFDGKKKILKLAVLIKLGHLQINVNLKYYV